MVLITLTIVLVSKIICGRKNLISEKLKKFFLNIQKKRKNEIYTLIYLKKDEVISKNILIIEFNFKIILFCSHTL